MSVTFTQNDLRGRMHIPERIEPFIIGASYTKRLAEENDIVIIDEATETIEINAEATDGEQDVYKLPDGSVFKAVCTVTEATETTPKTVRFEFPEADPKFKIGDLITSKYAFSASSPTVFKVAKVVPIWGSYNYYSGADPQADDTMALSEHDAQLATKDTLNRFIEKLENEVVKSLDRIKLLKSFADVS